ncbi:MAG: arylsulfatase [Planctomycetota bacterium]
MTRRRFPMKYTFFVLSLVLVFSPRLSAERPNIILLYADDLGYGDVGCYNPERGKIATPNLDRLASEGMRFTDGHSSSGVCTPSRYTILTGRYHWRSRLQKSIVGLWGDPLIPPDRMTVGSLAKQHGYVTACVGKWHLGWNWPIKPSQVSLFRSPGKKAATATDKHRAAWHDVFSRPIPGGPTAVGFDEYFGTDVPNWPPYCFIENDRTLGIPTEYADETLFVRNQASKQGPALAGWTLEPILPALADRAIEFIQRQAETPDPFLLYLPFTSPHTPLSVNDEWKGKSGLSLYADFVMETDAVVGRILDAIDDSTASEDTLVVFTSDNGCAPYIGVADLEEKGHYPSGPLRGYKADAWEGGHRVPFIVRWPSHVEPGTVNHQLVHQADLIATVAEILEAELPDDAGEDSFSFLPLLRGGSAPIRETSVSCSIQGVPSLRVHQWKYIAAPGSGGWGKGGDQSQPIQLYDLATDIAESKNLAANEPERVKEMQTRLEQLIVSGRSTAGAKQANDVEVRRFPITKRPR